MLHKAVSWLIFVADPLKLCQEIYTGFARAYVIEVTLVPIYVNRFCLSFEQALGTLKPHCGIKQGEHLMPWHNHHRTRAVFDSKSLLSTIRKLMVRITHNLGSQIKDAVRT